MASEGRALGGVRHFPTPLPPLPPHRLHWAKCGEANKHLCAKELYTSFPHFPNISQFFIWLFSLLFFSPPPPPPTPVFFSFFQPSKKRKMLGKWGNRFISRSLQVGYAFPHIFPSGEKLGDVGWCRCNRFGLWGWRSRSGWGWPVWGLPVAAPTLRVWPSLAIAPLWPEWPLSRWGVASGQ